MYEINPQVKIPRTSIEDQKSRDQLSTLKDQATKALSLLTDPDEAEYTLTELTSQYASAKAAGFAATYASHELANLLQVGLESHTFPAQSPQNVVSKMMLWPLKCESIAHPPFAPELNDERGVLHVLGSGELDEISEGIEERGNVQILIDVDVHSMA